MNPSLWTARAACILIGIAAVSAPASAQVFPGDPKPDVNIVGPTLDPADYRDEGLKQQNEPACAIRPGDGDCIICFFNDYRTVDILGHEDAWIGQSSSCDAGNTWTSRIAPNHPNDIDSSLNFKFAADPRVKAIPGMAVHAFIVGDRGSDDGKVVIQHWLENNKDDFNYYEPGRDAIVVDTGFQDFFLDKPDLLAIVHDQLVQASGCNDDDSDSDSDSDRNKNCYAVQDTVTLSTLMEDPELGTITRDYPAGSLYVAYTAFFSDTRSQLLVKKSSDWGSTWSSTATPLTDGNSLVSGLTLTTMDDIVMAMWRQVGEGSTPDAMYYATTSVASNEWSNPQKLADICRFDQPSATFETQVTFRTNDFPWLANDGKNIYAFYVFRQGDCTTGVPKVVVQYSSDGTNWSAPQSVADTPGAQFMPAAFGANGKVQLAWYDTSREMVDLTPSQPFVADFIPSTGVRVNRKVDVYTARITADAPGGPINISEPTRVSQYRAVADATDPSGALQEIEASFANALMFKTGELSFLGDYLAVAAPEFRPAGTGGWESNYSALPAPASNLVDFFIAYADNRDVRGDVLFDGTGVNSQYTPPDNAAGGGSVKIRPGGSKTNDDAPTGAKEPSRPIPAEGLVDTYTDPNTACVAGLDRTRDANIYGSVIRDTLRLSSPVESRPLSGILRAIPIVASNVTDDSAPYRLFIANQPRLDPVWHRASFRQTPDRAPFTGANYPDLATLDPVLTENVVIAPRSSVARTVFLVSTDIGGTVDVNIYDGTCAADADFANPTDPTAFASACPVLGSITVGGSNRAGDLRQPEYLSSTCGGDPSCANVQVTELHNPLIENPLIQNPLIQNPLIKNPLIKNVELEAPLIQNPLIQNPLIQNFGFENPLIQNPLIQNPLIQNPLIQNPLIQNPLIQNPLIQNSALASEDITYIDFTATIRNDGNVTTAYNFDATTAGIAAPDGVKTAAQLILWKQYAYGTSRDCQYLPEARNQVVATINNFDDALSIASIEEPFQGEASMTLAPGQQGFATVRIWGTDTELADARLRQLTVSSQAANCDEFDDTFGPPAGQEDDFYTCQDQLGDDRELILLDLTGPEFTGLVDDQVIPVPAINANAPGGACIQPVASGLVSASDPDSGVAGINCFNAEGDAICQAAGDTGLSVPVSNLSIYPQPQPSPMTCIAVDTVGNSTTVNVFVDVVDLDAPAFTSFPVNPTIVNAGSSSGVAQVNLEAGFAAEDVFGVDPDPVIECKTDTGLTSDDDLPAGLNNVTCRVSDASGNFSESGYVVQVNDVTHPVISIIGANPLTIEAGATYADLGADATDNVGLDGTGVVADLSAVDTSIPGEYLVTYTATDTFGNSTVAIRRVIVEDTTPPTLSLIPDITISASANGDAVVTFDTVADDNAATPLDISCTQDSGSTFNVGVTTVTCTATDASGNSVSIEFEVTVEDTTPPTVVLAGDNSITIEAGTDFVDPGADATDNVDGIVGVTVTGSVNTSIPGTYTLTYTATDAAGNSAFVTRDVNVVDTTAPFFVNFPTTIVASASPTAPNAVVDFDIVADDNAGADPSVTCDALSGSTFSLGSTPVTCTAEDATGNVLSQTFTVSVIDDTPPSFTSVPTSFTVPASATAPNAVVDYSVAAVDNSGDPPMVSCSPPPGTFGIGTTPVTCTATDAAGNNAGAGFTVTVVDTTPPTITVNGDSPLVIEAGDTFVDPGASASDNVDGDLPADESGAVNTMVPGTYTRIYTAVDSAGNSASATRQVVVADTTPPVVTVPSDALRAVLTGPGGTNVSFDGLVSVNDTIDPSPSLMCTPPSGSVFSPGATTVSCTGTDASGNSATASFDIIVEYGGSNGINPKKTSAKAGSSNPLRWAWQDASGNNVDSSYDTQMLMIVKCEDPANVVLLRAGDPGSSGFRVKSDFSWEFNWQSDDENGNRLPKGTYCAIVTSELTGQSMESPPIRLR